MANVEFEEPIQSLRGILVSSDPYYFRRYPKSGGGVMHIAQSRPNRSQHRATENEAAKKTQEIRFFGKNFTFRGTVNGLLNYLCTRNCERRRTVPDFDSPKP